MLTLNLPQFDYKLTKKDGKLFIWDKLRRKFVTLTPEEWVRQHFVHFLINEKGISPALIKLEWGQKYNSLAKRSDILVWNSNGQPLILVECKASHVALDTNSFIQAGAYNLDWQASYIVITNGMVHQYYKKEDKGYKITGDLLI